MKRTGEIIKAGQAEGSLRTDLKPSYLTFFFLGAVEALLSTMVLDDQPLRGDKQKKDLTEAVLTMFLEGARPRSK